MYGERDTWLYESIEPYEEKIGRLYVSKAIEPYVKKVVHEFTV